MDSSAPRTSPVVEAGRQDEGVRNPEVLIGMGDKFGL